MSKFRTVTAWIANREFAIGDKLDDVSASS
jgi:hypothetical protein